MVIDGNLLIQGYEANQLGLTAMVGPAPDINPLTTTLIQLPALTPTDKILANAGGNITLHLGNQYDDPNAPTYQRVYIPNASPGGYKYGSEGANDPTYQPYDIDGFPVYASAVRIGELTLASDHLIGSSSDDYIYALGDGGNDLIEAGAGHDKVYGGGGNDVISGGSDSDILNGGGGNDRLYADVQISVANAIAQGNLINSGTNIRGDWLSGGEGEDTLIGSTGNDVLAGGNGSDLLIGGAGDDDLLGDVSAGAKFFEWTATDLADGTRFLYGADSSVLPTVGAADVIYAGEGRDHVYGGLGNDVLFGEGGDDFLSGEAGNDIILGGAGKDTLWGQGGNNPDSGDSDYLDGGENDDILYGGAGDDIMIGGKGIDQLYGGSGRDTYIFNSGDGGDTIWDASDNTQSNTNILRFGAGISSNNITLRLGSLMLDLGNGDAVHIEGFNRNNVFNSSSISSFEFAPSAGSGQAGTTLTTAELLARGFDLYGTEGNDTISGTNTTDRIYGLGGTDRLFGDAGQVTLNGGDGSDELQGGDEADTLYGGAADDQLIGGNGDDVLNGDIGNDELQGNDGSDTLNGGLGNDYLYGQAGLDSLNGGEGSDQLQGGDDSDTYDFEFKLNDRIRGAANDAAYGNSLGRRAA